jgi:RNA polymerase sigma factor (TIGR02999 family)
MLTIMACNRLGAAGTEGIEVSDITKLIAAAADGDGRAADELYALVYEELRKIARSHRSRWHGDETIGTTALIHEAYLKLAGSNADFANRRHFYATASRAMRQILMNYAERRRTAKRNGDVVSLEVEELPFASDEAIEDLLTLHELLSKLDEKNPRRCRIIECRVFGGMTIEDTAAELEVSRTTVKREWSIVSAWLYRELKADVIAGPRP